MAGIDGRSARRTYNIGGDCQQTNADVVRTICRLVIDSGPNCRMPRARR